MSIAEKYSCLNMADPAMYLRASQINTKQETKLPHVKFDIHVHAHRLFHKYTCPLLASNQSLSYCVVCSQMICIVVLLN